LGRCGEGDAVALLCTSLIRERLGDWNQVFGDLFHQTSHVDGEGHRTDLITPDAITCFVQSLRQYVHERLQTPSRSRCGEFSNRVDGCQVGLGELKRCDGCLGHRGMPAESFGVPKKVPTFQKTENFELFFLAKS